MESENKRLRDQIAQLESDLKKATKSPFGKTKRPESFALATGKEGDVFYSDKTDKDIQAFASFHNRKVTTERMIAFSTKGGHNSVSATPPEAMFITKVTLGPFKQPKP